MTRDAPINPTRRAAVRSGQALAVCCLALCILTGCEQAVPDLPPAAGLPPAGANLEQHWGAYLDTLAGVPLQDGCEPFYRTPPPEIRRRGTVLMLHGFISCPQQYDELAELAAANGFVALVPLLPGHGRINPAFDRDDTRDLSTPDRWQADFYPFVARMNRIMAAADGDRVLVALSLGSATGILAMLEDRTLYDRALLFVPFLGMPGGPLASAFAGTLGLTPLLRETSVGALGWRRICLPKREQGRAGYCDYSFKHLVAINRLANQVHARSTEPPPLDLPLQVAAVDGDASVSAARIRTFFDAVEPTGSAGICVFPDDVKHS
ncbi:MAG: alpha/beta hydrolase, partial [Gammaproteobacteria bacterium]